MLGRSVYSRHAFNGAGEIERRLRSLEGRLEQLGGRASAVTANTADRVGDNLAMALNAIAEQFRGSSGAMSDGAAKIGNEAAKLGQDALRRLSHEVEHRPMVTLAIAAGVGFLVGLASHRR